MTSLNHNDRELQITELDRASGGSVVGQLIQAFHDGIAQGLAGSKGGGMGTLPPPTFPIGPATGSGGGGRCHSNHNGVQY